MAITADCAAGVGVATCCATGCGTTLSLEAAISAAIEGTSPRGGVASSVASSVAGSSGGSGGKVTTFVTLDPANKSAIMVLSEGDLRCVSNSAANRGVALSNMGKSTGRWYWEVLSLASVSAQGVGIGVAGVNMNEYLGENAFSWGYFPSGAYWTNAVNLGTGTPWTINSILGFALDCGGNLSVYVNGVLGLTFAHNLSGDIFGALSDSSSGGTCNFMANFGQDSSFGGRLTSQGNTDRNGNGDFYYPPPDGFVTIFEKLYIGEMEIGSTFKVD